MRRCPIFLLTPLFALGIATAARADAVTYQGTLGTLRIIVELTSPVEEGGLPVGRYAYLSKGTDIPLQAVAGKAGLTLHEEKPCTEKLCGDPQNGDDIRTPVGAVWTLESDGDGVTGTWTDKASGKSLPIALEPAGSRPIDAAEPSLDSLDPESAAIGDGAAPSVLTADMLPYDFLKMAVPLKPGKPQTLGEGVYRIDTDPRIDLGYPVIVSLGDADVGPVNAFLAQQRLQNALPSFRCKSAAYAGYGWNKTDGQGGNGYDDGGDGAAETITLEHLSPRLMGYSESGSYWCGGAHPDNFGNHHLVDVATGDPIAAETLLAGWQAIGRDDAPVDPDAYDNGDGTLSYRPSDALVAYVKQHREKFDAETESECGYDDLIASNLAVYVTQDSLVLTLKDLPHVNFACTADLVTVPLAAARELLTERAAGYFEALDR